MTPQFTLHPTSDGTYLYSDNATCGSSVTGSVSEGQLSGASSLQIQRGMVCSPALSHLLIFVVMVSRWRYPLPCCDICKFLRLLSDHIPADSFDLDPRAQARGQGVVLLGDL